MVGLINLAFEGLVYRSIGPRIGPASRHNRSGAAFLLFLSTSFSLGTLNLRVTRKGSLLKHRRLIHTYRFTNMDIELDFQTCLKETENLTIYTK